MAERDAIVRFLDETLEADQYRDHLPLGLQVPGAAEVTHVCTAVSASLDVFERAAADGAQMLIVHHGLFWDGSPRRIGMLERRRLETLFRHDLSLVAYHLPLDGHDELGNNAVLAACSTSRTWRRSATTGAACSVATGRFPSPCRRRSWRHGSARRSAPVRWCSRAARSRSGASA